MGIEDLLCEGQPGVLGEDLSNIVEGLEKTRVGGSDACAVLDGELCGGGEAACERAGDRWAWSDHYGGCDRAEIECICPLLDIQRYALIAAKKKIGHCDYDERRLNIINSAR